MFSFRPKRLLHSGYRQVHFPSVGSGPETNVAISSIVMPVSVIDSSRLMLDTDSDLLYVDPGTGECAAGSPWAAGPW